MNESNELNIESTFVDNIEFGFMRAQFSSMRYISKYKDLFFLNENYIYHYTDLNGLKGIISNNGFWLSEAKFLNDKEELINGKNLALHLINELINKQRYNDFCLVLENVIKKLEKETFDNYFIASFSIKADDLEQWRAYAKNGTGICIEFDINKETAFHHFPKSYTNGWHLRKVIYDNKIKCKILHYIIFRYHEEYKKDKINNNLDEDSIDDYSEHLYYSLIFNFSNFKHTSFSQEEEVRLIYHATDKTLLMRMFKTVNFRVNNNILIPYICTYETNIKDMNGNLLRNDALPISKIIVGPAVNQEITIESIKYFIKHFGYDENIVIPSKIPYRG